MISDTDNSLPNRRIVYRALVFGDSGLQCRLITEQRTANPRVLNLSMTGVAVRLDAADCAFFQFGTEAKVELRFKGDYFEAMGTVVRSAQTNTAFHFPVVEQSLDSNPPRVLAKIVMILQRDMLTRQSRGSGR